MDERNYEKDPTTHKKKRKKNKREERKGFN